MGITINNKSKYVIKAGTDKYYFDKLAEAYNKFLSIEYNYDAIVLCNTVINYTYASRNKNDRKVIITDIDTYDHWFHASDS